MTVERYHVTGVLVPVYADEVPDQGLIAGAPMEVDIIVVSTHPAFPARTAGWEVTLGHAAWRWERPPIVTRLEDL